MSSNDFARWTTSDIDFYALLGLQFESFTKSELRRAYRKTALKYHPDKVGKDFDPGKYEQFQAANEVLGDPNLKAKYDVTRNAGLQKQRANELFEGRRLQMKVDLEARERGGSFVAVGKRSREEGPSEIQQEMRRMAEEGRKRRAARESILAENVQANMASSPSMPSAQSTSKSATQWSGAAAQDCVEEDAVARLERRIREVEKAKASRKAEKKARKSGTFIHIDTSARGTGTLTSPGAQDYIEHSKRADSHIGLKAGDSFSATPLSTPRASKTPSATDFTATMARLKAAQQKVAEEATQKA